MTRLFHFKTITVFIFPIDQQNKKYSKVFWKAPFRAQTKGREGGGNFNLILTANVSLSPSLSIPSSVWSCSDLKWLLLLVFSCLLSRTYSSKSAGIIIQPSNRHVKWLPSPFCESNYKISCSDAYLWSKWLRNALPLMDMWKTKVNWNWHTNHCVMSL